MPKISRFSANIPAPEAASSSSASPSSSAPPPPPPWIELPRDVMADILQRLGIECVLEGAQRVCATWWKVCKDPAMWRVIHLLNAEYYEYGTKYNILCRRAVDRSRGELVDLTMEFLGNRE